ncbi:MAG: 6,7-dimethyl-8-ribityllumazine synthase [Bacteroidales bacterium]|nr:6,7-dimethyl-8-ribityllumazine synthase [Bacteroidales bacterium]
MPSKKTNLSSYNKEAIRVHPKAMIGIVVSEWNKEITEKLYKGAFDTLTELGVKKENIIRKNVPGSFELPYCAKFLLENTFVDAVICLGCVIQGETRHFEFISGAVANGIMQLNVNQNIPVIFGVLTTDTTEQARERAGGRHGNKGTEAAVTALKMMNL